MENYSSDKSTVDRVEFTKTDNYLSVRVPSNKYNYGSIFNFAVTLMILMTPLIFLETYNESPEPFWVTAIILGLMGIAFGYRTLICYFVKTEFYIDRQTINRSQWLFGRPFGKKITIPSYGIMAIEMIPTEFSGRNYTPPKLVIDYGHNKINLIGNFFGWVVVDNLADDETVEYFYYELMEWLKLD
jgi:hypothetical protein